MLSCLRDARTSITGVKPRAFTPTNLKANLADYPHARRGGPETVTSAQQGLCV